MLRDLLRIAPVFDAFTKLVSGNAREIIVRDHIRARTGDAILDIGCGTAAILAFLPEVRYIGFDPSAEYIAAARRRFGKRGEFHQGICREVSLPRNERFDVVMALGVLHHVDDAEALSILRLAQSVLKPGGRFFSFDGCFVPSQSLLVKWLLRHDRGGHVRTEPAYRSLAESVFPRVETEIHHRMLRIPYTHIFMQCSYHGARMKIK